MTARALVLDAAAIGPEVDAVRAAATNVSSNWFLNPLRGKTVKAWSTGRALAFVDVEPEIERVYFVGDGGELGDALAAVEGDHLVLDHFGRGGADTAFDASATRGGFSRAARYLRIRKTLKARAPSPGSADRASPGEVDRLFAELRRDFDPRLDYLPSRAELAALVEAGQALIARRGDDFAGYLVYRVDGVGAKWDYLGTRPDAPPMTASALVAAFEADLSTRAVRVVTGWVDERKGALLAAYAGLGHVEDGLVRTTYLRGSFAPAARAAIPYPMVAPASADDVAGAVRAALAAVNDAVPKAMQVGLEDEAALAPLDSLALMNLLVGVEQALLDALDLEVRVSDAAAVDGGAPLATVGSLIAFASARAEAARS